MREDMKDVTYQYGKGHRKDSRLSSKRIRNSKENKKLKTSCYEDENASSHKPALNHQYRINYNDASHQPTLNPLRRFLMGNIGKKWDDVYSEICKAGLKHWANALVDVHLKKLYRKWSPTEYLYVDENGILTFKAKKEGRKKKKKKANELKTRIIIKEKGVWYVKHNDIWYTCKMSLLPKPIEHSYVYTWGTFPRMIRPSFYDCLMKEPFTNMDDLWYKKAREIYGRADCYCVSKKQCRQKEIKFINRTLNKPVGQTIYVLDSNYNYYKG